MRTKPKGCDTVKPGAGGGAVYLRESEATMYGVTSSQPLRVVDDRQRTLEELTRWLRQSLDRTYCRIMVADHRAGRLRVAAASAAPRKDGFQWQPRSADGATIADLPPVFLGREPIILHEAGVRGIAPAVLPVDPGQLKELLIIPLLVEDRIVGWLDLGECRTRDRSLAFAGDERRRTTVSDSDGGAHVIDHARQAAGFAAEILESERKRQLLERLEGILRELQPDAHTLWREVSRLGAELLKANVGAVYVCQPNTDKYVLQYCHGSATLHQSFERRIGFLGAVAETRTLGRWDKTHGDLSHSIGDPALKAALAVALRGADVDAVLVVGDDAPRSFSDVDLEVLERFVRHASIAHRRVHRATPDQRKLAEFRLLRQISDFAHEVNDVDDVLRAVLTGITAGYGLRFNRASLFLLHRDEALAGRMAIGHIEPENASVDWQWDREIGPRDFGEYLVLARSGCVTSTPLEERVVGLSIPLGGAGEPLRSALQAPTLLLSGPDTARLPERLRSALALGAQTQVLLVRLMSTRRLGLLIVDNRFTNELITPAAIDALAPFVSMAVIAIETFQESTRVDDSARAVALADAPDAGDVAAVTQRIVNEVVSLCDATCAVFWPYYQESGKFAPQPFSARLDARSEKNLTSPEPGMGGTTRRILDIGYFAVNDVNEMYDDDAILSPERCRLLLDSGIRGVQGIALQVGSERLGALYVDYARPRRFAEADERRLTRFAMHAALTLKTARLSRGVHDDQFAVDTSVLPLPLPDRTFQDVADHMKAVTECDVVTLHVYNAATDTFERPPRYAGLLFDAPAADRDPALDRDLLRWVMAQIGPIGVEDSTANPRFGRTRFVREERIQSCVAMPLRAFDMEVGALFANFRSKQRFAPEQIRRCGLSANQAAIGIGNALKVREYEVLASVARALLYTEDLQGTFDAIARMAAITLGHKEISPVVSQVVVKEGDDLVVRAVEGGDRSVVGTTRARGDGSQAGYTVGMPEPVSSTYQHESRFAAADERRRGFKSGVSARMTVGEDFIGVLEIKSERARSFGESHNSLLTSVAVHAAMAIRSAERNARLRRSRGHLKALRDAEVCAEQVRRAGSTRTAVLQDLLKITVECFRAHSFDPTAKHVIGTLLLCRPVDILVLEAVYPLELRPRFDKVVGAERSLRTRPVGITGRAALDGRAALEGRMPLHRAAQMEFNLPGRNTDYRKVIDTTQSEIAAPIISCGSVVGVLDVESDSPRGFDKDDLATLVTLAGFVAVALANHSIEQIYQATHDLDSSMSLSLYRSLPGALLSLNQGVAPPALTQQLADFEFHQRLTQDIMAAAMVLNKEPLFLKSTPLGELVQGVVDSFREAAAHKDLGLDARVPDAPLILTIDRHRMRQVIVNLIANAIKYTKAPGAIEVCVTHDRSTDRVVIAVHDSGPNPPPEEHLPQLFEPYHRERPTTVHLGSTGNGTQVGQGLGLSIAKTLVELHGGHIKAEHNDRGGLSFVVSLAARNG